MNNTAWNAQERHTILELWNEAVAECPDTVFLHFLDDDEKYTYAEFDERSNSHPLTLDNNLLRAMILLEEGSISIHQ